jgi:molybdate transport system substrate-binding protein
VFAAASLSPALTKIAQIYESEVGRKVRLVFGSSAVLARQIEQGAPASIFISADLAQMKRLQAKNLIPATMPISILLSNRLVIVVPKKDGAQSWSSINEVARCRKVAVGQPESVPAGVYAREYLSRKHLWRDLERRIVPTENVRAALVAVELGMVDAAFVYETDARNSKQGVVAWRIEGNDSPEIAYPGAILKHGQQQEEAQLFYAYLQSAGAAQVFESFGFIGP